MCSWTEGIDPNGINETVIKMNKLQQALNTINFDESNKLGGEYGLHDGFFNAVAVIDGVDYYFQGCADDNDFDANDCGHDDGMCGDVNDPLATKLAEDFEGDISEGFDAVRVLLIEAFKQYEA